MTTLDHLLANYTLEEEYIIDECPCLELNKYDAWSNGHDIILQFTIHAQDVQEAYLIFPGYRVSVVPKQIGFEQWVICLQFPGIAIGAFCFSMCVSLYLPGAVDVQRVISISKRFLNGIRPKTCEDLPRMSIRFCFGPGPKLGNVSRFYGACALDITFERCDFKGNLCKIDCMGCTYVSWTNLTKKLVNIFHGNSLQVKILTLNNNKWKLVNR